MIEITLNTALLVAFAALIATVIRVKDEPALVFVVDKKLDMNAVATAVGTYIASALAAIVTAWLIADQSGIFISSFAGFVIVSTGAIGGMATVRAALNAIAPKTG